MKPAIDIRGLQKEYRLNKGQHFKALDRIDLQVNPGEVLGLIGHNGAGKSTLLKILSRITAPTAGEVLIRGSLSSLLEVGTGFHPELSGRENIYLNGHILGMKRAAIKARFDEIVAFAGIERFLDTPVKRYSSGMFVRLAFSVAAYLDAEILLIDEVLAVGDAAFQKKCLARMNSISQEEARTIVFVSHNMSAIQSLCQRVALLENGQLAQVGDPQETVERYLSGLEELNQNVAIANRKDRQGTGEGILTQLNIPGIAQSEKPLEIELGFQWQVDPPQEGRLELHLFNARGNFLTSFSHHFLPKQRTDRFLLSLPQLALMPGRFFVNVHLYANGQRADFVGRAGYFQVNSPRFQENEVAHQRQNPGVLMPHHWQELKP